MDCIKKEFVRTDADGHKWWRVVLTATEAPDSLQLTGADVDGMDDNIRFEAGSVLLTPDKNYIAFEDGDFSGEGGGGATVTFDNKIGEVLPANVGYAASVQAVLDGDITIIPNIPTTSYAVQIPVGSIIITQPPVQMSVESGNLELKYDDDAHMDYIEVSGDGVVGLTFVE